MASFKYSLYCLKELWLFSMQAAIDKLLKTQLLCTLTCDTLGFLTILESASKKYSMNMSAIFLC